MSVTSSSSTSSSYLSGDEFSHNGHTRFSPSRCNRSARVRAYEQRDRNSEGSQEPHQRQRRRAHEPLHNFEGHSSTSGAFSTRGDTASQRSLLSEHGHRHSTRRGDVTGAPRITRRAPVSAKAVTPRERDMIIYRLQRQVEAVHQLSSSCMSDSDASSSPSPSTLASSSSPSSSAGRHSGRGHGDGSDEQGKKTGTGGFTPRGIDVWATPVHDDEPAALPLPLAPQPMQYTPDRTRYAYNAGNAPHSDAPRTTVVHCSEPYSTFGASVIRIGETKTLDAPACRAVVRKVVHSNAQRRHVDPQIGKRVDQEGHAQRNSTSPLVLEFVDYSDILVEKAEGATTGQWCSEVSNHESTQRHRHSLSTDDAMADGTSRVTASSVQTDSAVQAALFVAKQLLRREAGAQTPSLLHHNPSRMPTTPSNRSLSALTDVNGQDEATTTEGLNPLGTVHHTETGSQCDVVEEKRVASRSTETMPKELRSKGVHADVSHANAGVETEQCHTSARGTSPPSEPTASVAIQDMSAIASTRDVTPSPTRTPPLPTPQRHHHHTHRAFVSPVAMRNLANSSSASKPRKVFTGTITPLGRRTPTREHHHVNSPVHGRDAQQRLSPDNAGVINHRTEGLDRRIALKCVKFAVFSDFSRTLDFKVKMSMTLREARDLYDSMSETDLWGHTGVYRQSTDDPDGWGNTRIDELVQGAMTEVVRGACQDWSTWFAGVSRRRVEEALSRFSDIFPAATSKYIIDGNSGGVLMRVPVSRVEAVASVLY